MAKNIEEICRNIIENRNENEMSAKRNGVMKKSMAMKAASRQAMAA
jgi:hypothetical protein